MPTYRSLLQKLRQNPAPRTRRAPDLTLRDYTQAEVLDLLAKFANPKLPVRSTAEAVPWFRPFMMLDQEVFCVLPLDGSGRAKSVSALEITKGLVDRSFIHPRELFREAIKQNAVSIIIAHNHPSGNLEASDADLEATRRIVAASKVMGIPLLDHVIVSHQGYFSIREHHPETFYDPQGRAFSEKAELK